MKTRELIAALQEADPSGELDCVAGNVTIVDAHCLHAAYDGPYERIRFDENGQAIGADYVREGQKVELITFSIEALLLNDPEAPVGFIGFTDEGKPRYEAWLERERAENRKIAGWADQQAKTRREQP